MKRRQFLNALLGAAVGVLPSSRALGNAAPTPVAPLPEADVELVLRAAPEQVQLLTGPSSEVWRFTGQLMRGASNALETHRTGYLGPTLRVKRGQRVRVHFENALDELSIVHWHGLDVAEKNDGHPLYAVAAGKGYSYDFTVENRAGTYWYGAPSLREGILDEGWQDTFLLLPGDTVRVQKRFEHHLGLFLYHCHNLEHEDMGMMRNFLVEG